MTNFQTAIALKKHQRDTVQALVDSYMARAGHVTEVPQGATRYDALMPRTAAQQNAIKARLQKERADVARFEMEGVRLG